MTPDTTNTRSGLRFTLKANYGQIYYHPSNAAAETVVPEGRRVLRAFELVALLDAGYAIEINLNPYLGVNYWVAFNRSNIANA